MASLSKNSRKKWIITISICAVLLLMSTALFIIHYRTKTYNSMYDSMTPPLWQMVLNESIFIYAITILGMTALSFMNRFVKKDMAIALSVVIGAMLWSLISKFVICTGLTFNGINTILVALVFLAVLFFVAKPDRAKLKDMYFCTINIRLIMLNLSILFSMYCIYAFSYDSYIYVSLGEKIVKIGHLTREMMKFVSGFSLFTSMFFSPAEMFGFDFSIGYYTYFIMNFVGAVSYVIYTEIKDRVGNAKAIFVSICSFLAIVTANVFFMLIYLPLSNLIAACGMFFMVYFIYLSYKNDKSLPLLLISLFFALCFVWTRSENGLFVLMVIFLLTQLKYDKKSTLIYSLITFGAIGFWYMRFFLVAGRFSEGDFLTIDKALMVLGAYVIMIIYVALMDKKFIANNTKVIKILYYAGLTLCLVALVVMDLEKAGINLQVTITNLFRTGGWGFSMVFLLITMMIYYYMVDEWDVFDKILVNFALFYMLIYMLRGHSLRVGYGDSGNRYLTYIIPYIIFMVSTRLIPLVTKKKGKKSIEK